MKNIIFIVFMTVLFISCKKEELKPSHLGTKFNSERKKVGLRIIDSTMSEIYGNGYDEINNMYNPIALAANGVSIAYGLKQPSFFHKNIFIEPKKGELIFEEDVFASGVIKITVDDYVNEELICRYVFKHYNEKASLFSSYSFSDFIKIKKGWQYIHVYPIPTGNKLDGVQFYYQKLDYITKKKADSILSAWKIKRLNY